MPSLKYTFGLASFRHGLFSFYLKYNCGLFYTFLKCTSILTKQHSVLSVNTCLVETEILFSHTNLLCTQIWQLVSNINHLFYYFSIWQSLIY